MTNLKFYLEDFNFANLVSSVDFVLQPYQKTTYSITSDAVECNKTISTSNWNVGLTFTSEGLAHVVKTTISKLATNGITKTSLYTVTETTSTGTTILLSHTPSISQFSILKGEKIVVDYEFDRLALGTATIITVAIGAAFVYSRKEMFPYYTDDLSFNYEKEGDNQFFRRKLSKNITFIDTDYDLIKNSSVERKYMLLIQNVGFDDWRGRFHKTDCKIDIDDRTIEVTPYVYDGYNEILDNMDKELNLIDIGAKMVDIVAIKRAFIQLYVENSKKCVNILRGTSWETEASGDVTTAWLNANFGAGTRTTFTCFTLNNSGYSTIDGFYKPADANNKHWNANNTWYIKYDTAYFDGVEEVYKNGWVIFNTLNAKTAYFLGEEDYKLYKLVDQVPQLVANAISDGDTQVVWFRVLLNNNTLQGVSCDDVALDDIFIKDRSYRKRIGMSVPLGGDLYNQFVFYNVTQDAPTKYNKNQLGKYYSQYVISENNGGYVPIAIEPNLWGNNSFWYVQNQLYSFDDILANNGTNVVLRDNFELWSVISRMLLQYGSKVTHENDADYSYVLYQMGSGEGLNVGVRLNKLCISPKRSVLIAESNSNSEPTTKSPITFNDVFSLFKAMNIYWHIENGKLMFEHISWYLNGGTYGVNNNVSFDLTTLVDSRNKKPIIYGQNKITYDKPNMPSKYEFNYMDKQSDVFEGLPIEIVSSFVDTSKKETISTNKFSCDIDLGFAQKDRFSNDGYFFIMCDYVMDNYVIPIPQISYYPFVNSTIQNGFATMYNIHNAFWKHNLPSDTAVINGNSTPIEIVSKTLKQDVQFTTQTELDLTKLVTTNVGNGKVDKLSLNLISNSVKATLEYSIYEAD